MASDTVEIRIADNVFVVPDKRAKAVTGWLVVMAGCADEADGDCRGISHYVEHLLFIDRDGEHKSKIDAFAGGAGNAQTTHKATTYFQRFPSDPATDIENVDKLFGYFAGLLSVVKADAEQSERERNVVLQEYNQSLGRSTYARFGVTLRRALMPGDALGQSIIGSPETIKELTLDAARDFHKYWYTRTNAVIVLYGPIDPDAIKRLIEKHLDPLPSRTVPPHTWALIRKYGSSTQVLKETDKTAKQVGVYLEKIVHYEEPTSLADRRALNSARDIVGAFLISQLVGSPLDVLAEQDNLIAQGSMSLSDVRAGTLRLSFSGVPTGGVAPEAVIDAVQAYLRKLPSAAITAQTVERLKMRSSNARDLLRQQKDKYAEALVNWFAGHHTYDDWRERDIAYARVSVETVRTILDALAQPGREVIGIMLPADPLPGGSLRSNEPKAQQP